MQHDNSTHGDVAHRNMTSDAGLLQAVQNASVNASGLNSLDVYEDMKNNFFATDTTSLVLVCIYVPVFLVAILGNIFVLLVILPHKSMRSVTNYFLVNLAVADLLVAIFCIPLRVGGTIYRIWVFGEFLCKISGYFQGVSVAASVLTITAQSLDRYLAIRHSVKARSISTVRNAKLLICLIWVVSAGIMAPLLIVRQLLTYPIHPLIQYQVCHEQWSDDRDRKIYDTFLFVCIYVVPGSIIITAYSSTWCHLWTTRSELSRKNSFNNNRVLTGRRRVARMLICVAIFFAVSWLPYQTMNLYFSFNRNELNDKSELLTVFGFALLLGHAHSAQNPILYCFTNTIFKKAVLAACRCQGYRCNRKLESNAVIGSSASQRLKNAKMTSFERGSIRPVFYNNRDDELSISSNDHHEERYLLQRQLSWQSTGEPETKKDCHCNGSGYPSAQPLLRAPTPEMELNIRENLSTIREEEYTESEARQ